MANLLVSDSLRVRVLEPAELPRACEVSTRAFNQNALDWYKEGVIMAGEDPQGKMVCSLEMMPQEMWWGPAPIPAAAIGGVATRPDEQKKGYAVRLLIEAIHHMRAQGQHLCPIWPFSLAFYRKVGWGYAGADLELKAWPDMLRRLEIDPRRIRPARPGDAPAIADIYNAQAQMLNGRTRRDAAWLTSSGMKDFFPEKTQVHLNAEGCLDGFVIYRQTPQPTAQGLTLRAIELVGAGVPVQMEMLRALAEIPNVASVEILLPRNSPLPFVFHDRVPGNRPQRLMIRVLDVAKALSCLMPSHALKGVLAFEVLDTAILGDKPVCVTAEFGQGEIAISAGSRPDALRCTIDVFSQIFTGGLLASQARAIGRLEGGSPETDAICESLLGGRVPFRSETERG